MSTMTAARAYSGESEFRLEQIERPQAGPGEVLIEVKSAGLAVGVMDQWRRGVFNGAVKTERLLESSAPHSQVAVTTSFGRFITGQTVIVDGGLVRL